MGKVAAVIAIVLVLFVFGGFVYYNALNGLEFQIIGVDIEDISSTSARFSFKIEVSNSHPIPVYLTSTYFDIFINKDFLTTSSTREVTIGANSLRVLIIPISIYYTSVAPALARIITGGGTVTAEIIGEAYFFIIGVPFTITKNIVFR